MSNFMLQFFVVPTASRCYEGLSSILSSQTTRFNEKMIVLQSYFYYIKCMKMNKYLRLQSEYHWFALHIQYISIVVLHALLFIYLCILSLL